MLISAFAISPCRGSEYGVGWNIVTRLAKYHDVTVLYGDMWEVQEIRKEVEDWIGNNGPIPGLTFEYVPQGRIGCAFFRLSHHFKPLVFLYYTAYRFWHMSAHKHALFLHCRHPFDLVHILTYVGYREPGYLWKLPIPLVWGPIAGAENVPWKYFSLLSLSSKWRYSIRNIMNTLQMRGIGNIKNTAKVASHIWAATDEDRNLVEKRWGHRVELLPETGTDPQKLNGRPRSFDGSRPLVAIWSGLHDGRKALPIVLQAMARLAVPDRVRLVVLGSGSETNMWKAQAIKLKVSHLVEWCGHLPLHVAQQKMDQGDIFVFTSIKEASSTVVMEALSLGLPVVCHNACGMKNIVDPSCGILVPMVDPRTSAKGFCNALQRLLSDPTLVTRLSRGAIQKREEFTWDKKVRTISDTYRKVAAFTGK